MFGAQQQEWGILGVTQNGAIFDAPDWSAHLCGMVADQAQDKCINYTDYLTYAHINGHPAVVAWEKRPPNRPH
jgi:hypothetical protein